MTLATLALALASIPTAQASCFDAGLSTEGVGVIVSGQSTATEA